MPKSPSKTMRASQLAVLDHQGPVEPQIGLERGDVGVVRGLRQEHGGGIGRVEQQDERDQRNDEGNADGMQQLVEDVGTQALSYPGPGTNGWRTKRSAIRRRWRTAFFSGEGFWSTNYRPSPFRSGAHVTVEQSAFGKLERQTTWLASRWVDSCTRATASCPGRPAMRSTPLTAPIGRRSAAARKCSRGCRTSVARHAGSSRLPARHTSCYRRCGRAPWLDHRSARKHSSASPRKWSGGCPS